MKTAAVNQWTEVADICIMRGGPWGNPFRIGPDGDRATVIAKHRQWIIRQPQLVARLRDLRGKRLGCCCKPLPCHGDTLAALADQRAHFFQGSCHEILSQLPADSADLLWADPPYNIGVHYADDPSKDRLSARAYRIMVHRTLRAALPILRPGGTLWWMAPEIHADWMGPLLTDLVGPRLYRIVWEESFSQYQGDRALTKDYRFIFCHQKSGGPSTWNPAAIRIQSERQRLGDKRANPAGRVPGCVWRFRRLQGTSTARIQGHPTQLPPELLTRVISGWTNPEDRVAELFSGAGSLGVLCSALERDYLGIERSQEYVELARARVSNIST
jgi:hypothetical protein